MTSKDLRNIHTAEIAVRTHLQALYDTKTTLVFLPTDGKGGKSGLREPNKNKHQH